ncbi:MerR family transcriptional regulator [Brevundimonas mediterranea]|uniref:DNA-binding transcriptional MerR regulator n=1 Tax=Brevundimonas mediterranea TaxID=74329 RepID=A0A7W6A024_9CAUL|nr:MerR family transcriptional regulator [Brevundimonas mediterranea]MBB3870736.1 DNA-binding transcriptional MerR regulator [Brevundimonas mediterranea]
MRNAANSRTHTVSQLARMSGVSVRTLHHYDQIGLLKPAVVGENGYRHYGREELLRLQQILLHREFGMALCDIRTLLDRADFDRLDALREQRRRVDAEAERYRRLALTIDRAIAEMEGRTDMAEEQIYAGFDPKKQADYEAWIIDKYGEAARPHIERGRRTVAAMSGEERAAYMAEVEELEADFGRAMGDGLAAEDARLDPLLARHHAWLARSWASPPAGAAYAGLADLYLSHPDFVARYEAIRPGLANWLATAIRAYAGRALA